MAVIGATAVRAARHEVLVGDPTAHANTTAALVFYPDVLEAAPGDIIRFVFTAPGSTHRVVKGLYGPPCVADPGGFDSGYRKVSADNASHSYFDFEVRRNYYSFYFFCAVDGGPNGRAHCLEGMVGMVNGSPAQLASYRDSAKALSALPPIHSTLTGQGFPTPTARPSQSRDGNGTEDRTKMLLLIFFGGLLAFLGIAWQLRRVRRRRAHYAALSTTTPAVRPVAGTTRSGPEELELPRYEERRGDALLAASDTRATHAAPTADPPPEYAR
ncbi:hypothetical protein AURDEDRAFT_164944 [Auricularia subglabra TFB-10046 SS5]|nr:hypothetical protein AURDEDRAFT_164944 [Auricularia subglabra TFB-10046 SS5]